MLLAKNSPTWSNELKQPTRPSEFFSTKAQIGLVALSLRIPHGTEEEMLNAATATLDIAREGTIAVRASACYDALYATSPCTASTRSTLEASLEESPSSVLFHSGRSSLPTSSTPPMSSSVADDDDVPMATGQASTPQSLSRLQLLRRTGSDSVKLMSARTPRELRSSRARHSLNESENSQGLVSSFRSRAMVMEPGPVSLPHASRGSCMMLTTTGLHWREGCVV